MNYTQLNTLLGSGSSGTSPAIFVGDARTLSISIITSTTSSSNFTISVSNSDGFQAAAETFSVATILTQAGLYIIEPGARWLQAQRPNYTISATSNVTIQLAQCVS